MNTPPIPSAQVKTALVPAGLQASGTTEITEPSRSRDHTERMLVALGAPLEVDGTTVRVRAGKPSRFELTVPGDPSSAAFWWVAAAITPSGPAYTPVPAPAAPRPRKSASAASVATAATAGR